MINRIKWNIQQIAIFLLSALVPEVIMAQLDFELVAFATGLESPVDIVHTSNDLLYIVEKSGKIRIVNPDGSLGNEFLDIEDQIPDSGGERGLLGMAFHPGYPDSNYIYVNYTGQGGATRISRYTVNSDFQADPMSEFNLLTIAQPYGNHNGGDLLFGPDGMLYIALGDGGSGGDPQNRAQSLDVILGKILRIDVDGGSPFAVPAGNPFVGTENALDEIWIYGVRNPWRIFYDEMTDGLYFGDVGQNNWEEVNFAPFDLPNDPNYGWRCYEGNDSYDMSLCEDIGEVVFPIYTYAHTNAQNCSGSITGGVVYRGTQIPSLYGKYLYADYCNGQIGCVDVENGYAQENLLDFANFQITSFGLDNAGEMYLAAVGQGTIYKFYALDPFQIFSLDMNGAQVGTASTATGEGVGIFELSTSTLCLSGSFAGLSGSSVSGHCHEGASGISGLEIFTVMIDTDAQTSGAFYGCSVLSEEHIDDMLGDGLYVDIHTNVYPSGEIRGQILLEDCPGLYELIAPVIPAGNYHSESVITAGILETGSDLNLLFEESVTLNPGFEVGPESIVEIWMDSCMED